MSTEESWRAKIGQKCLVKPWLLCGMRQDGFVGTITDIAIHPTDGLLVQVADETGEARWLNLDHIRVD